MKLPNAILHFPDGIRARQARHLLASLPDYVNVVIANDNRLVAIRMHGSTANHLMLRQPYVRLRPHWTPAYHLAAASRLRAPGK